MHAQWESVAAQVAELPRRAFGETLQRAGQADRKALLRARYRFRGDEFAQHVIAPIISRTTKWSPLTGFHRDVLALGRTAYPDRTGISLGLLLAPRGAAKTTATMIRVLHAVLYGTECGIAVVGAGHREAITWARTIRTWLTEPEVVWLYGEPTIDGTQADLILNDVPMWARGWTGSLRGLNRDGVRPSLVVLDDIESERTTSTLRSRDDTVARLAGVIAPLGPAQGGLTVTWLATPCHHDAAAARVLRGDRDLSSWQAHRYPAVVRWPDAEDVWEQAKARYLDLSSGLTPDERWDQVLAYLREHPEAFEGAQTIDAHRLPIATCWRRRWDVGELAWAREYDVRPTVPGAMLFDPDKWPRFRLDGDYVVIDNRRIPWRSLRLSAAWDPSDGGDDGAIAVLGREPSGRCYLLDSKLLPIRASLQAAAVVEAAKRWGIKDFLVEENQFGSLGRDALDREARAQGVRCSWVPVTQTRNKETRLSELEAPLSNGLLAVRDDIPAAHLRQAADFDPRRADNADDLLDAIEMAFRHAGQGIHVGTRPLF